MSQAETELRNENERLRARISELEQRAWDTRSLAYHMDYSPLAVIEWGPDMRLSRWSGEAERLFGWTAAEALGKRIEELHWVYDEDVAKVAEASSDLRTGADTRRFSANRNYRKDGSVIYCEWYNSALMDESGKLGSILSLVLDVTARTRAEEALRQSERRFRALAEAMPNIVWSADASGAVDYYNRRAYEYRGVQRGDIEGSEWISVIHPDDFEATAAKWRQALDTGKPGEAEHRLRRACGEFRWHLTRAVPVRDEEGRITRWIGTSTDVQDLKQAQEALSAKEDRLRVALQAGQMAAWDWHVPTGELIWDDECYRMMGYEPGAVEPTYHRWLCHVHPEDRAATEAALRRSKEQGVDYTAEYRALQPDGSVRWIEARGRTERDQAGAAVRQYGVMLDVTEHKRVEDALRESESRFKAIASSTLDHVLVQDRDLRYTFVINPQFGLTMQGMIGKTDAELLSKASAENLTRIKRQVIETGKPVRLETQVAPIDGHAEFFEGSYVPKFNAAGEVDGLIGYFRNVTEQKRAEERLRQAQKMESLGLLAGGVAHDFNNLLVGVIGNASLAIETLPPGNPADELLREVIRSGEQAADLTRQMLAYSGKGRFIVEPLNLSDLLPEMCGLIQASISKKASLHLALDQNLPCVEADRGQIQQVFMNLSLNAAEAIGSEMGVISVRTGVQEVDDQYRQRRPEAAELSLGTYIYLEVQDTGCGMNDATKAKIFDPFFSTKFTGRGLGLAAVAGIVRGHRGAIMVTSAPGKGSCFTVLLPASSNTAAAPQASALKVREGSGTVLVVDDEEVVRSLTKRSLERFGYQVLTAENGTDAIEALKRRPEEIALVILDLSMPGMSGEEVLPELRRIRPEIKVVVSSGYSEAEAMRMFQGRRVSGFIQKPYTAGALAAKVKEAAG